MRVGEEAGSLERTMNEFCIRTTISTREPGGGERGRLEAKQPKKKRKEKGKKKRTTDRAESAAIRRA